MTTATGLNRSTGNRLACIAVLGALGFSGVALAQKPPGLPGNYPSKPVKVTIPVGAGGGTDFVGRLVMGKLGEMWGASFLADNQVAGGGMPAMDLVHKAVPDGSTLAFVSSATYIRAAFVTKMDWDVRTAFVPIAPGSVSILMLAASNNSPFKKFREMIAYAKANPGKLDYSASALGSSAHLTGELIWFKTGVKATVIPYKGSGQAVIDTIAGRVPLTIGSLPAVVPHAKAGKLTVIGVTSGKRSESAPEFPTLSEVGLPGFDYSGWFGLVGPTGVPPAIVNALNKAIMEIVRMPDVKAAMLKAGADPLYATPEEFRKIQLDALDRTAEVLKATGLELKED